MRYHHGLNRKAQKNFKKRTLLFLLLLTVLVGVGAIVASFDIVRVKNNNTKELTTSAPITSFFEGSNQIFKSPYFQFQANKSWTKVTTESTDKKFVYRSRRGNLIEREFTVYINQNPSIIVNRVLPANPKDSGELLPINVSDHCSSLVVNKLKSPQKVVLDRVTMDCTVDSTSYNVLVGLVGESTTLSLPRPNSPRTNYIIYYSDVTANPDPGPLRDIVSSFQTR